MGVTIADGWYKSKLATGRGNDYGDTLGLLLQLEITYEDGSSETITSDETFKFSYDGPYRYADLFTGVKYDARMELSNYSKMELEQYRLYRISSRETRASAN